MNLKQYLAANSIRPEEFAEKIGVSISTVYRLRAGSTKPEHATMLRIFEATGQQVTADDFWLTKPSSKEQ